MLRGLFFLNPPFAILDIAETVIEVNYSTLAFENEKTALVPRGRHLTSGRKRRSFKKYWKSERWGFIRINERNAEHTTCHDKFDWIVTVAARINRRKNQGRADIIMAFEKARQTPRLFDQQASPFYYFFHDRSILHSPQHPGLRLKMTLLRSASIDFGVNFQYRLQVQGSHYFYYFVKAGAFG